MQAVILSFDALIANSIGCYGNDWVETPSLDSLASTGILFDQHFTDSLGSKCGMAWANGIHALAGPHTGEFPSLGSRLRTNHVRTTLMTVDRIRDWQSAAEFDSNQIIDAVDGPDVPPDEVSIARLVKAGLSEWRATSNSGPRLLWLHAAVPPTPPRGFDSLYFEDFEERGQQIAELTDADRAAHPAVYAGAVSLIDHWVGQLLNGIDAEDSSQSTLVIVTAAKGHLWQRIPTIHESTTTTPVSICDQTLRTPLILNAHGDARFQEFAGIRSDRLVQACDLVPTLFDWFAIEPAGADRHLAGRSWLREIAEETTARASLWIDCGASVDAIRTAEWLCVRDMKRTTAVDPHRPNHSGIALFAKPEDIWDVNNLVFLQPDVCEEMCRRFPVD